MKKLLTILFLFISATTFAQRRDTNFIKGGGGTIDSLDVSKLKGDKIDTSLIPQSIINIDNLGAGITTLRGSNDTLHSSNISGAGTVTVTKGADSGIVITGTGGIGGTATLSSGTVTVSTVSVKTGAKIFVTYNTPSGTQGFLSAPVASIVDATSFVINSSSASDNSTVNWQIINP